MSEVELDCRCVEHTVNLLLTHDVFDPQINQSSAPKGACTVKLVRYLSKTGLVSF